MPMAVSTVTSIALRLKLRFMLGCSQHFPRVAAAFGSAASARAGRTSVAAADGERLDERSATDHRQCLLSVPECLAFTAPAATRSRRESL